MSAGFSKSGAREFERTPNRDRNRPGFSGGGTIIYNGFRAGYAGDNGRVYREMRARLFRESEFANQRIDWVQIWRYRSESYGASSGNAERPPVPDLIYETGKPADISYQGLGVPLSVENPNTHPTTFIGDNYKHWSRIDPIRGALTLEWSDPVNIGEHIREIEEAFEADMDFPGREPFNTTTAYPGAFRIRRVFMNTGNTDRISPNDSDGRLVRRPSAWAARVGGSSPFFKPGAYSVETARAEDLKFLNPNFVGSESIYGWPVCGIGLQVSPAMEYTLTKTDVATARYKRAVFRRVDGITFVQKNCDENYVGADGILRVMTGEVSDEMQTRADMGGKEFWGLAGGTGDQETDLMNQTYSPAIAPSCW